MADKKIPINRSNKFFSDEDLNLEIDFGLEYLESDINTKVILYRLDRTQSITDDLYGEAQKDEIRVLPPVEISASIVIEEPENKSYNSDYGTLRYLQDGKLTFNAYVKTLEELGVDITYGDYISYVTDETTIRYYSVVNDGKINTDNAHTILGVKGVFRTIICAPADENEFSAI